MRSSVLAYCDAVRAAMAEDTPVYLAVGAYGLGGLVYLAITGNLEPALLADTTAVYTRLWFVNYGLVFPLLIAIAGYSHVTVRLDQRRNLAYRAMFAPSRAGRLIAGSAMMIGLLPFIIIFTSVKNSLSVGGFHFDVRQADIDRLIHFGTDPWHFLFAVGQHPIVLRLVEFNYNTMWYILCYGALYWVATSPRTARIRVRYVLSFIAVWVIAGNIAAGLFISAGPAYYAEVTGDALRFGRQMAFIATSNGEFGAATDFQTYLWDVYQSGRTGLGSGIAAFPSVHVALITLNALFIAERSRRLGLIAALYTIFVLASSVYLGWHYAIDGYAAIVLTVAIYALLRRVIGARLRPEVSRSSPPPDSDTAAPVPTA